MAGALSLQAWQWGLLALAWVVFFLAPAFWMARKARRDGDQPFVWTVLVLVGSFLGVLEYYHHRSILKRRAKRAALAASSSQARDSSPAAGEGGAPRDEP